MKYLTDKITPDMAPLRVAVVHPVDAVSLQGAFNAASAKLMVPVLVGPEAKIREAAQKAGIDLTGVEIHSTEHSHAAAQKAVELIREGKVEGLMKGSLHTNEFLTPIVSAEGGMRTERRMSHVFVMTLPGYDKPVWITDAALIPSPDLMNKKDIIQNTVDLFWKLEGRAPLVAVLAATEDVDPKQQATVDAAMLSKMAQRGQIKGAIVDGPLAYDNAMSMEAVKIKGIVSDVAGKADILVVPDLNTGNVLFKALNGKADEGAKLVSEMIKRFGKVANKPAGFDEELESLKASMASDLSGIVLGARIPGTDKPAPIILTSRAASPEERQASAALALLNVRRPGRAK